MATDTPSDSPRQDGNFVSQDSFANPHEKLLANTQTATDANGVERIISPSTDAWSPAPLEASEEEIAAAERRNRLFDQASKDRQAQFSGDVPEGERAVNNPADGGSQTPVETNDEAAAKADAAKAAKNDNKTTTDAKSEKASN